MNKDERQDKIMRLADDIKRHAYNAHYGFIYCDTEQELSKAIQAVEDLRAQLVLELAYMNSAQMQAHIDHLRQLDQEERGS